MKAREFLFRMITIFSFFFTYSICYKKVKHKQHCLDLTKFNLQQNIIELDKVDFCVNWVKKIQHKFTAHLVYLEFNINSMHTTISRDLPDPESQTEISKIA